MKKVTIFKDIWDTKQPHFIGIDTALERIQNGKSYELVTGIRNAKDKAQRTELKKSLPSVCWSGKFRVRKDSELLEHSGLAVFDFDDVGRPDLLKDSLTDDRFVFASWISPSGNGLKVLVKIPPIKEDHRKYYSALLDHFPSAQRDDSNINESRACFESYDKDIYINWESEVWTVKKTDDKIEQPTDVSDEQRITDPVKIYSILKKWMDRTDTYTDGNRHNFYVKFAFNLCECGVSLEDTTEWLIRDYPHENENGAENSIISGWKSKEAKFGSKGFKRNDTKESFLTFWDVIDGNEAKKVVFNRLKFIDWLHGQGICRYKFNDGKWIYGLIKDQVATQIYRPEIKHIVKQYVETLPPEFDGIDRRQVLEMLAKGISSYFSDELLDWLNEKPINWNRHTPFVSYFYYQNTVVEVTEDGYKCISYGELPGVIWNSQIIDRAFVPTKKYENDFRKFCKNVCNGDAGRYESIKSIIGYLLSDYKDPNEFPAVVLMDETISDYPEGGTGKGLFGKGIRAIKNAVVIDGKNWNTEKSFAWQRIDLDTKLVLLEDVVKKFDFEKFYSITAEGIEVEKKNQQSFYIPFVDSPKMIITTNYTIQGEGGSTGRRIVEIEFSPFYSPEFTPQMDLGRLLFDDWNDNEWNAFDNYMMGCVQFYLKNKANQVDAEGKKTFRGIVRPIDINRSERKLADATHEEFIAWMDEFITLGERYDRKKDLFYYFTQNKQEFSKWLKPTTFNKWCKSWANYRGYELENQKSGNDFFFIFTSKGGVDPLDENQMPF